MKGGPALLLLARLCSAQTQSTGSLAWNGKTREYTMFVPESAPTGLIVALAPTSMEYMSMFCSPTVKSVSASTGAITVCPAAQTLVNPGGKNPGSSSPCWKAFEHYGYCLGGQEEDSEDVEFLAALIGNLTAQYKIPEGKVIMSGFSNGGSMAYRFSCEKSELIGGLVIQSQAYFDPVVGYYDYTKDVVPSGTPGCNPKYKRPFYSDIGTTDEYYGPNVVTPGFAGIEKWESNYSKQVLGCLGEKTAWSGLNFPQGAATCYEYSSCPDITGPKINRFCSISGMGHDQTGLTVLLPKAFADFFGGPQPPNPPPGPPSTGDWGCYQSTCYEKAGWGTMSKAACEAVCQ